MKNFIIDHIDPLGQGVFKEDDQIFFIPKTLPSEQGEFKILKKKKGVHFGKAISIKKSSPNRINPECEHFLDCPGCHFQHTNYDQELSFKKQTFHKLLKNTAFEEHNIDIIKSPERFGYRNRIQLHYNLKTKSLGFQDAKENRIINVPNCIITVPQIQKEIKALYQNSSWIREAKKYKTYKGHVELYYTQGKLIKTWNKSYADGGFTQVNQNANIKMLDYISQNTGSYDFILDLFGGNGNISDKINFKTRLVADFYKETKSEEFINQNLYSEDAISKIKSKIDGKSVDLLILDPPRSGLKELNQWIEVFNPKELLYISCSPPTMRRDLVNIEKKYTIKKSTIIDLFPSTFHYESLVHIKF